MVAAGRLRLGRDREMGRGTGRLLTLIGGLRCLRDIHSQLSTEGIHAHHSCVDRSVGEGRELAVVAGDAVQSLRDVSRSLQNNLLKSQRNIPFSHLTRSPGDSIFPIAHYRPCSGLSMVDFSNFCTPLNTPMSLVSSLSHLKSQVGDRRPHLRRLSHSRTHLSCRSLSV